MRRRTSRIAANPAETNRNRLLAALRRDSPALRQLGELVTPPVGRELTRAGAPIEAVYFPIDAVLSVLLGTEAGGHAEVFTVGNEGMLGLAAWLGISESFETIVVQSPGVLVRISAPAFCEALERSRKVRRLLNHFLAYTLRFAYQNAVCNAHHSVDTRACRWLLSSADRAQSHVLVMTQSLLADMLGVRRQSVGEVAVALQRAGVIRYRRNQIVIADRSALEQRACECYALLRRVYARLVEPML